MENKLSADIIKQELQVKQKYYVTPHYIRIVLDGPELAEFNSVKNGANNKIMIPVGENQFVRRTYTCRSIDLERQEMFIDFVAHGDTGPASKWATHATPGQKLTVMMRRSPKDLIKPAQWYLFAGDHSALPVIAALLEGLHANSKGVVFMEVFDSGDVQVLEKPAGIHIHWLFNPQPGKIDQLSEYVMQTELPENEKCFVFVAAEYKTFSRVNDFLKNETNLERSQYNTFSYWKYGQAEE